MATIASMSLTTPRTLAMAIDSPKITSTQVPRLNTPWRSSSQFRSHKIHLRPVAAAPDGLSEKVADSIKTAEEACSDDPVSGECVAAWDEVEELSAAASHARDRQKDNSDPLEAYCKDNPETDECRTYDN
ncbi:hypothetical protein LIER_33222 [Lithospermum erythrorhizon]|uniref:CP12 domain-containing protein n=1 Tax=Lithospermum erythrorhizon TaxID=34254 RepID=A0AAV3RX03_LITER